MMFFDLVQSAEISLGTLCFALFAGRAEKKTAIQATVLAVLSALAAMSTLHWAIKDVVPMSAASLVSLILTGFLVCGGVKFRPPYLLGYALIYGTLSGLSAYELRLHVISGAQIAAICIYFLTGSVAIIFAMHRLKHRAVIIAQRVLGSWISAAGILMLAFIE